jgi:hypothetical protein
MFVLNKLHRILNASQFRLEMRELPDKYGRIFFPRLLRMPDGIAEGMLRGGAGVRALVFFSQPLFSIQAPISPCMYDPPSSQISTAPYGNIVVNTSQGKLGHPEDRRRLEKS